MIPAPQSSRKTSETSDALRKTQGMFRVAADHNGFAAFAARLERQRDEARELLKDIEKAQPVAGCDNFHHANKDLHAGYEDCRPHLRWVELMARIRSLLAPEKPV